MSLYPKCKPEVNCPTCNKPRKFYMALDEAEALKRADRSLRIYEALNGESYFVTRYFLPYHKEIKP